MMNDPKQTVVFTLEEHNEQAPRYESRHTNLEDSINQIRRRYRHTEAILASRRARLNGEDVSPPPSPLTPPLNDLPDNTPTPNDAEQDFRLPEIEMPPPREYSLDHIPDELFDNAPETDGVLVAPKPEPESKPEPEPESPPISEAKSKTENVLAKLFKRYQHERDKPFEPSEPSEPELSDEMPPLGEANNLNNFDNIQSLELNDLENVNDEPPIQASVSLNEREFAQQAYLHYREHEHNQRVAQSAISEDDIAILMQEDWLAAQQALKMESRSPQQTLHLQMQSDAPNPPKYHLNQYGHGNYPAITVHVYDLPDLPSTRKIRVWSEQELLAELQRQLRPHLSQAVAGLMHHVLQKKLANLSYDLQMMLNEETPRLVEDILAHNVANILREMKERL